MEQNLPNIIGYHTNKKDKCQDFINGKLLLSKGTNDTWLGKGMYFWDNFSNAIFWRKKRMHSDKCPYEEYYGIVRSNILINNILDLTDENQRNKFANIWLIAKQNSAIKNLNNIGLGQKIDYIFESFPDLFKEYPIIRAYTEYSYLKERNSIFENTNFTYNIKNIYSVRDNSLLKNREIIKDEEYSS